MATTSESPQMQCHGGNGGGGGGGDGGGLPEDQVFEMLTRVSLDDLAACRQVSSRWRRLTYEPAFAPLHCRRADAVSGYLVQGVARNRYSATFVSMHRTAAGAAAPGVSLDFLPCAHVRVEAVSAHRGLACCVDADAARTRGNKAAAAPARCYYVCKPATREWTALPSPRLRFPTAATAMVARPSAASPADFKILRLSVPTLRDCLRCEIYDSRRRAWRRSSDVMFWPESLVAAGPAVRAHGAMHWLRWPDYRLSSSGAAEDIFAFDMKSETWRLIGLPPEVVEETKASRKKLVAVEGKLCLVVVVDEEDDGETEVWAVAGYGGRHERWEKKMVVSLKSLAAGERNQLTLRDLCSSHVAFLNGVYTVMWYDFWKGKLAEVAVDHKCIQEVFKYESDLVPCDIDKKRGNFDLAMVATPKFL